ncbi:MAG: HEAT repeat domain-containing protein [Gemmataceae bacterium]|nr:HEAT repeat domain-containing protein [Gemmataceae bacterium]
MKSRLLIGSLVTSLLLCSGLGALQISNEPTYKGKPVSDWLTQLKSEAAKERVQAAVALGAIEGWKPDRPKAKEVTPALIHALKDKVDEVRAQVALTLAIIGPQAKELVSAALLDALKDKHSEVRLYATEGLGRIGAVTKKVVPGLSEALKDKDARVRSSAARALGEMPLDARAAVPSLIAACNDTNAQVRLRAGEALKRIDPEAAKKAAVP